MMDEILYVDGATDAVLERVPREQVPLANRAIYLKGGQRVDDPTGADEIIPVARVVGHKVDAEGAYTTDPARVARLIIQQFDAAGQMLAETIMVPPR